MSRWEPGARSRLEQAAMELYSERGFDDTTVAQIAELAGLTERTFFRYFADKREVLFEGAGALQEVLVSLVDGAPESMPPLEVIVAALVQAGSAFEERREFARRRQAIIAANAELGAREVAKMASLGVALAAALRRRGVPDLAASLAAESGVTIFRVGFERWVGGPRDQTLGHTLRETADELAAVTGALALDR